MRQQSSVERTSQAGAPGIKWCHHATFQDRRLCMPALVRPSGLPELLCVRRPMLIQGSVQNS
jgi:hypothetical protein